MQQILCSYFKKNSSLIFLFFTISFVLLFNINESYWRKSKVIDWDVTSYYGYLPALFIHNDLALSFTEKNDYYEMEHQFWPEIAPNGGKVIKTTMGMAFLYSPFFVIAHLEAKIYGLAQDGFSYPYHKWIHFAGVFYFLVGIIFLRKVLLNYFSELATGISLFIIVCCTNALYYASVQTAMPHIIDFCLLSIFLFLSIKWLDFPTSRKTILLGLISGIMILIRPTNILFFLFPLLLNIVTLKEFKSRFFLFLKEWKKIIMIALIAFIILIPQFLYWYFITGDFIFNSYIGESFYWTNPHILEGLFSYRKGWLLYSPVMSISIVGFIILFRNKRELFWSIFPFFIINIYVLFCWWSWWYGGGFGMRSLIDCYPLLAIPLAAFVSSVIKKKKASLILLFVSFITLTLVLNTTQIKQYRTAVIHWDGMTKKSYWASFGGRHYDSTYWELIKLPDYEKAKQGVDEYCFKPF